jgi:hypothetical protein
MIIRSPHAVYSHRRLAVGMMAGLLGAGLLAGCGSSGKNNAEPPAATSTTPTAAAPTTVPTTPAPATTLTPPPTTTLVGLVLSGSGNTFAAPTAPTTKPFSANCRSLLDPGYYGECVTVVAPTGTIAAIVEQQQQNYQSGQPITTGQERDLVYREVGHAWSLVLRRTPVATGESISEVYESDVMRDGDPKAVFVEPAANSQYGNELDVVEGNGIVTLYRQLHGGFAAVPAGGGLETYTPDPADGYDEAAIAYTGGAWKIMSLSHVSESQAQSLSSQAFFDPHEIDGTSS